MMRRSGLLLRVDEEECSSESELRPHSQRHEPSAARGPGPQVHWQRRMSSCPCATICRQLRTSPWSHPWDQAGSTPSRPRRSFTMVLSYWMRCEAHRGVRGGQVVCVGHIWSPLLLRNADRAVRHLVEHKSSTGRFDRRYRGPCPMLLILMHLHSYNCDNARNGRSPLRAPLTVQVSRFVRGSEYQHPTPWLSSWGVADLQRNGNEPLLSRAPKRRLWISSRRGRVGS
jgi:hypothetical protein